MAGLAWDTQYRAKERKSGWTGDSLQEWCVGVENGVELDGFSMNLVMIRSRRGRESREKV